MPDTVEHDLRDGPLPVLALAAGFVIDRARQALGRLGTRRRIPLNANGCAGGFGPALTGIFPVGSDCVASGAILRMSSGGGAGAVLSALAAATSSRFGLDQATPAAAVSPTSAIPPSATNSREGLRHNRAEERNDVIIRMLPVI
jgi:hypothetical protein